MRKKCPYLEFVWLVFSRNTGKYRPGNLRRRTPFTQCSLILLKLNTSSQQSFYIRVFRPEFKQRTVGQRTVGQRFIPGFGNNRFFSVEICLLKANHGNNTMC